MRAWRNSKVTAIVIKRRNVGEADRLLTLFTREQGKLRALAKGVRRISSRRASLLEIFSSSRILLYRSHNYDYVSEVEQREIFANIRNNLIKVSNGYFFCELIDILLPEKQQNLEIFDLLENSLKHLDETSSDRQDYPDLFALNLLRLLGYLPSHQTIHNEDIQRLVERIAERRIRSARFLTIFD